MFFLIFKDGRSQFSFELINLALKDFEKGFQRFQFEKGVRNFPIKVHQSQVLVTIENLNQNNARPLESSMAEMAVQGLHEFWPCNSKQRNYFRFSIDANQ